MLSLSGGPHRHTNLPSASTPRIGAICGTQGRLRRSEGAVDVKVEAVLIGIIRTSEVCGGGGEYVSQRDKCCHNGKVWIGHVGYKAVIPVALAQINMKTGLYRATTEVATGETPPLSTYYHVLGDEITGTDAALDGIVPVTGSSKTQEAHVVGLGDIYIAAEEQIAADKGIDARGRAVKAYAVRLGAEGVWDSFVYEVTINPHDNRRNHT